MREWIETNGLGGYASSTQTQDIQRKFHGLFITSLHPPVDRWVFVSNIHDDMFIEDTSLYLNHYGQFFYDYLPKWNYVTPYGIIKKTICMPHEKNTTIIKYDVSLNKPATLMHHLHLNSRHFYDTFDQPHGFDYEYEGGSDSVLFKPKNVDKTLNILFPNATFDFFEEWHPKMYQIDCQRNDSCYDHILHLGSVQRKIKQNQSYFLVFSTEKNIPINLNEIIFKEIQRRKTLVQKSNLPSKMNKMILASDRFLVKKPPYHTIIAGYHWFSDWGRDTLIALPGITLIPHRFHLAKEILQELARFEKKGIIPNTFNDRDNTPAYNTVDASLWYIDRVFQYLKYTNDLQFLHSFFSVLQRIITAYKKGTYHHIFMDTDYLISHDPGLTWMDVKLGEYLPTPRGRKAVEIQALWYNALCIMSRFAEITQKENPYKLLSEHVKESFTQQYSSLYDVLDTKDESIRPNMIFLASLDFSMISSSLQKIIVDLIEKELLTIFGLRSLNATDPQYKPRYIGDYHRDLAYHNGTVWPWLLGFFIKAKARLYKENEDWKSYAFERFLSTLFHIYGEKWDGSVHEIFDAEPPFAPRGCISQAWSVAEILRAWVEDIEGKKPPFEKVFLSNKICI